MASEDDGEALTPSERRLTELLAILAGQAFTPPEASLAALVRRARRQHDTRVVLVAGSSVLASALTGVAGLLTRSDVPDSP